MSSIEGILNRIDSPKDLKNLTKFQLESLCQEIREFLLNCVSQSSGHLASGLGVVELTVALHYVYNTPQDKLIWDVGHQCYPHKILTKRKHLLKTIRKFGGLHPFLNIFESEYDAFGVGHSSTSISAALGFYLANQSLKKQEKIISIIGDGALTAGMAFEALNHAGSINANMLVILNDNKMSISPNVGALQKHFAKILSGGVYTKIRKGSKKVLEKVPPIKSIAKKAEEHLKNLVCPSFIFEELGFNYIGPIDGHDLDTLMTTLSNMKNMPGPQFLHVITAKGKGYKPAEQNPIKYHGVPKFNLKDEPEFKSPEQKQLPLTYSETFGTWLCYKTKQDKKLLAITPAMKEGSGMVEFAKNFPDNFIDVAIAEQHALTLGAAIATTGVKPIVAIYSTFLQRAYDQLIHDIALQNLGVVLAIDRAGVVGEDGQTHQGVYDIAYLRIIPNMTIMTPSNLKDAWLMLNTAYKLKTPASVRYPKASFEFINKETIKEQENKTIPLGKAKIIIKRKKIALLNFGMNLEMLQEIATYFDASLIDMRFVKPLDENILEELSLDHEQFITFEDGVISGGAGSNVLEFFAKKNISVKTLLIGVGDEFLKHGSIKDVKEFYKLDKKGILLKINNFLEKIKNLSLEKESI